MGILPVNVAPFDDDEDDGHLSHVRNQQPVPERGKNEEIKAESSNHSMKDGEEEEKRGKSGGPLTFSSCSSSTATATVFPNDVRPGADDDDTSAVKSSPTLEKLDPKSYLEWFSSTYKPGAQLGRNKPDTLIDDSTFVMEANQRVIPTAANDATLDTIRESKLHDLNAVFERLSSAMTSSRWLENSEGLEPSEEFILRELNDIRRLLLQRFLIQRNESNNNGDSGLNNNSERENVLMAVDPEMENDLFEILRALNEEIGPALGSSRDSQPHFPVGEWTWTSCQVCYEHRWLFKRACCGLPVCNDCLKIYFSIKVNEGVVKIECCNSKCKAFVHRDEISACLDTSDKQKFHQRLAVANAEPWVKTCPRCNHITVFIQTKSSHIKNTKKHPVRSRLVCTECNLTWCFSCHAPWHPGFTCSQFRKGDRLMKSWANEVHHGQLNAQKCPRCQVYIQRTTGCDHMHCIRCKTDFCYRCGDRLRKLRFFGDHYSKLSIFGCKFRYKADQPMQRKLVRGAVFGSKLMVAPVLGTLGACAGVIALGFGIFILPVYGGVRLYQKLSTKCEQQQQVY